MQSAWFNRFPVSFLRTVTSLGEWTGNRERTLNGHSAIIPSRFNMKDGCQFSKNKTTMSGSIVWKESKGFFSILIVCRIYSICCCCWWCCFAEDERTAKRYCKINNNACVRSAKSQFLVLKGPASVV